MRSTKGVVNKLSDISTQNSIHYDLVNTMSSSISIRNSHLDKDKEKNYKRGESKESRRFGRGGEIEGNTPKIDRRKIDLNKKKKEKLMHLLNL